MQQTLEVLIRIGHEVDVQGADALLEAHEGEVRAPRLSRLALMRIVSDFREAMWGVLQQGISTLDVDFVEYADEHFERLRTNGRGLGFEVQLHTAALG